MKYYNILGFKIEQEKFKARALKVTKEAGLILLSLFAGFSVWLLLAI